MPLPATATCPRSRLGGGTSPPRSHKGSAAPHARTARRVVGMESRGWLSLRRGAAPARGAHKPLAPAPRPAAFPVAFLGSSPSPHTPMQRLNARKTPRLRGRARAQWGRGPTRRGAPYIPSPPRRARQRPSLSGGAQPAAPRRGILGGRPLLAFKLVASYRPCSRQYQYEPTSSVLAPASAARVAHCVQSSDAPPLRPPATQPWRARARPGISPCRPTPGTGAPGSH